MTWTITNVPSFRIEYHVWVSVWKPRLVVHAHWITRVRLIPSLYKSS